MKFSTSFRKVVPRRLVRFLDEKGLRHFGEPVDATLQSARIIEGDVLCRHSRSCVVTDQVVRIDRLLAPVEAPPAILCIGMNYRKHAKETGLEVPRFPVLFVKNPSAVTGHGQPIVIPQIANASPEVDYECEMAIVIGRGPGGAPTKDVSREDAMGHVLGFTAANDVSARRWQGKKGGGQWCRAKSFDSFAPMGPSLTFVSDSGPHPDSLDISTTLNGDVLQSSNTSDMVFDVASLVSFLSEGTTLLPGTVVLTGTPEGVGFTRDPPVFLKNGDVVTVSLEGVGDLTNTVQADPPSETIVRGDEKVQLKL